MKRSRQKAFTAFIACVMCCVTFIKLTFEVYALKPLDF